MRVTKGIVSLISDIVIDSDIDMLTLYQVKRLASPASGEALRKGNKDIVNAEVADAAAILRSKLNFGDGLVNADIAAAAAIALDKLASLPATLNGVGIEATVAMFQVNGATGDFTTLSQRINDDNLTSFAEAGSTDQYAEVDYGLVVSIKRWRQYGDTDNNGNGEWKIQYYNLTTHAWVDWATGIATRTTRDWSSLITETEVLTDKIRLIAVAIDSASTSNIAQLEVIF